MMTAYIILRTGLGVNIFLHGAVRLYLGRDRFLAALQQEFEGSPVAPGILRWVATLLPVAETVIGVLLLTGLGTRFTIVSGTLLMLLLMIGKSLRADWQTVSLQMIYIAFYAALAFFDQQLQL